MSIHLDENTAAIIDKLAEELFYGKRSMAVKHIVKEWGEKRK
jgi:metal-responsive CopG/Arc/MetJ family transcriptional regulator